MPYYYINPHDAGRLEPNGARIRLTPGPWMTLAAVENCPCGTPDSPIRRKARTTGHADTAFSVPAEVSYKGRKVRGFLTTHSGYDGRPEGTYFRAYDRNRPADWPTIKADSDTD